MTAKTILLLFLVVSAALIAGCATVPLNPETVTVETKLTGMRPLAVRAAPSVWKHVDEVSASGFPFRNETGRSFAKVFAGTLPEMPVIEIVSSTLRRTGTNAGFAAVWEYDVTIRLIMGPNTHDLSAKAKYRATGFTGPNVSAKIVTEDAISQLVAAVQALIGS